MGLGILDTEALTVDLQPQQPGVGPIAMYSDFLIAIPLEMMGLLSTLSSTAGGTMGMMTRLFTSIPKLLGSGCHGALSC